jgi:hypothetical protein
MAANGREPGGERDKPKIDDTITQTGDPSDTPKSVANAITGPKSMGQVLGSSEPAIANTITKSGPNR